MSIKDDFYVYVLFRETGEPFYIGKGRNDRYRNHTWPCYYKTNSHKNSIIRKTLKQRADVPIVKIMEGLSAETAYEYERIYIKAIGRWPDGPLLNKTDGGDGALNPSLESRAKLSASRKGFRHTAEAKAKIGEASKSRSKRGPRLETTKQKLRSRIVSAETRAKISEVHKGRPRSEEERRKTGEAMKKVYALTQNTTRWEKISESLKGHTKSEEHKRKLSVAGKKYYDQKRATGGRESLKKSPEHVAKIQASILRNKLARLEEPRKLKFW